MSLARIWHGLFGQSKPDVLIGEPEWARLIASCALFEQLSMDQRTRLRELCTRFLARKSFSAAGGHELIDSQRLAIAAFACLPVLELGFDWLDGWSEIIVYAGSFRVRREHHDEHSGVVTEGDDELIGEAWERGPIVLSWADVAADLESPFDGFNVVIHEIAHKLDMLDGAMNGVPRLPPNISRAQWVETMQSAYDELVARMAEGLETIIDPYAAESVEEFFAVVCEHYYSLPTAIEAASHDTCLMLNRLFNPRGNVADASHRGDGQNPTTRNSELGSRAF